MSFILLLVSLYAMLYPFVGIYMLRGSPRIGQAFSVVLGVDIFLVAVGVTIPEWAAFMGVDFALTESQRDFVNVLICTVAALGSHIFIFNLKKISRGE